MSKGTALLLGFITAAAAVSTAALFYFDRTAGFIQLGVVLVLLAAFLVYYLQKTRYYKAVIEKAEDYFEVEQGTEDRYPLPVVLVGKNNDIVWYNDRFRDSVMKDVPIGTRKISDFLGSVTVRDILTAPKGKDITLADRRYTVYAGTVDEETGATCLYFLDNTELKKAATEYFDTRPAVLYLSMDNLDELQKNYRSSECEVINGGIETILERWAGAYPCLLQKYSSGNYFMLIEERGLQKLIDNRFEILKQVRDYSYGESNVDVTISIGAGRGDSLVKANKNAKTALEMSESRGGDQATVNTDGQMEFFGGTVGGTTSSSKVKARIMAQNFADEFKRHDIIFTTGHTFSDLDSIGASFGVAEMAKALGKPCYIIANRDTTMASALIEPYIANVDKQLFVDGETARSLAKGKTSCLVVVDTHRPNSLEYPDLTDSFTTVSVIDHHRRTANAIRNAELFYNEPNSSSACEMVTELIQYWPKEVRLSADSANALLSGIMLDTRNFVLGTGVRTFEAAAYLKNHGADTVAVKQLFSNSLDTYKVKASVLTNAETYHDCVIARATETVPNMRVIASQVADELLSVTNVKSSYVLFEENGRVNISARSLGQMNVQVIMEQLGGGGHFTMAATQMKDITVEEAIEKIKAAIDDYARME